LKDIVDKIKISPEASIKEALKGIDEVGWAILFVCDEDGCLQGSLTDGDIRRWILKEGELKEKISSCFNRNPVTVVRDNYTLDDVRKLMLEKTVDVVPVIDSRRKIVDILCWKDVFDNDVVTYKQINVPVVIMAGGKGERLGPFTKILPKPLIPLGEKPAIKVIMDRFIQYGVKHFYVTLNHKGEMVKIYFESEKNDFELDYIWEKKFLGTAGSLKLLPPAIGDTFIVSNCDVIIKADYSDLLRFHSKNKNLLTVVGSIYHQQIPYGIINFEKEGKIKHIQEKPEFDFTVNTGLYIMSSTVLDFIPENTHFDMTDLIQVLLENGENVGVYPISQKSYVDIGQLEEYKEALGRLVFLRTV